MKYTIRRISPDATGTAYEIVKDEIHADDFEISKEDNSITFYKIKSHDDETGEDDCQNVAYFPLDKVISVQAPYDS